MQVKISYPNDYGSEADAALLADYAGNVEGEALQEIAFEAMSDAAKTFGCSFVSATDYGAIWDCPESDQIRAGQFPGLPDWASFSIIE